MQLIKASVISHPNDLPLFEGQLLVGCVWVGGHGQRVVVKEGHEDPEGLLRLRLIVVRGGAAIPVSIFHTKTNTFYHPASPERAKYE